MFETLYNTYANGMLRYATKITNNYDLACDVVQESFFKILQKEDTLEHLHEKQLEAYIIITVKHTAYKMMEKWGVIYPLELETPDDKAQQYDTELFKIQQKEDLEEAISKLPEIYKDVIVLHYYMGFKFREIAKMLNINPNHATAIASNAKKKLRQLLTQKEHENDGKRQNP